MTLTKIIFVFIGLKIKESCQWGWYFFIEKVCKDFLLGVICPVVIGLSGITVVGAAIWGVVAIFNIEFLYQVIAYCDRTNDVSAPFIANFLCLSFMSAFISAIILGIGYAIYYEITSNWWQITRFFKQNWEQSKEIVLQKVKVN